MASSILKAILGEVSFKVVSDRTGFTYWKDLKVLNVDVLLSSLVVDQPLATTDIASQDESTFVNLLDVDTNNGKIIQPTKLRVKCLCANLSTVEDLMYAFNDVAATFTITSRSIIADEMIMVDMQIVQSDERLSAVEITIEWEQAGRRSYDSFDPFDPANDSTYGIRVQSLPSTFSATVSGIRDSLTSAAESLYNRVQDVIESTL